MTSWHKRLTDRILAKGPGSYIVNFPAYRPDLVSDVAEALGCTCLDFRKAYLAPMRFEAHKLALSALEAAVTEHAAGAGIVLQNGEALLACKPASERSAWCASFLDRQRSNFAILPLALFGREAAPHPNLLRFLPHEMPPETLLSQLTSISVRH
ncbi:MAG TPA: hypothetical protein PKW21_15330 [Rhabdaerophilum sp.]|nr:hypothetical protein [Rhabdaerophilum sp.]